MIEVKIPKELDHYEAKTFGPFTTRQAVCLVCALPLALFLYNFTNPYVGDDIAGFICFIPAVFAALFGWVKPYGMKFEVFLRSVFITTVLAPSKRKYKTANFYKKIMSESTEEADDDFFFDEEEQKKNQKKKKTASDTYKPSKKAIF